MAVTRQAYAGGAVKTTLNGAIVGTPASFTITLATGWPTGAPFPVVVDPGASTEEKILVTRSGTTLTVVTRGYDGTASIDHATGAAIYVTFTATELDTFNRLAATMTTQGDLIIGAATGDPVRLAKGTAGLPLVAGASTLAYEQLGTAGIADLAVTEAKLAASLPARHGVQAGSSVTTTATSGTTVGVAFNTEQFDTDGYHDNVTNNSRFTVPAGLGGLYVVSCQFNLGLSGGNGFAGLLLNGNFFFAGSGAIARFSVSQPVLLNAGDFVEAALRGISGDVTSSVLTGSLSEVSSPRFVMAKISA